LIGFFGSGLYFAVDKYEPDRTVAFVLKCLVVMWGVPQSFTARVCLASDFSNQKIASIAVNGNIWHGFGLARPKLM
jgi:hypothetical protein